MARRSSTASDSRADVREAEALAEAWAEVEPPAARRLLVAGVMAFAARGYDATRTRDIADRAGLSPAGLYVHFPSKEELLYRICATGTRQSLEAVRRAALAADADPRSRLQAVITTLTVRGAEYPTTGRVIEDELGSLDDGHRAEIVALRREIDGLVREIIEDGVARGVFDVPDVPATTLAVLSLAVDVARWYGRSARLSPGEVGAHYADLAWRMVRRV